MTKRLQLTMVIVCVLLAPTFVFAKVNSFGFAKTTVNADNLVVVPITISNDVALAALDIPLSFSEGVTLKEVNFEGTRVEYFDMKIANIDNENRTVLIGLIPQMSPIAKADLAIGEGVVANLVFEINDDFVTEISIKEVVLNEPYHALTFVNHSDDGIVVTSPEFSTTTVLLSNGLDALPEAFELMQNYPNPFNPSTSISFALPNAGNVSLAVFNVLGQKVITLVDGQREAGVHVVQFDGSSLSSGMYFYRLVTETNTETKKMVMLK